MQINSFSGRVIPETIDSPSSAEAPPTASEVGDRLKLWRRSRGVTQKDFAESLGVDVGTLRKYELGLNVPGGLFLARLCGHGLNINWLLLGGGTMSQPSSEQAMPAHAMNRINELANAMEILRNCDTDKFDMLLSGFVARCREAVHLAQLEKQMNAHRETAPAQHETGAGPFDAY